MPTLLDVFQQRLAAGIQRSPLLRLNLGRDSRLLDCARLAELDPGLPRQVLACALEGKTHLALQFDLQGRQAEMYDLLERRIRRQADLARRETGVHALWLGYPLVAAEAEDNTILAPLLLWPLALEVDLRHAGRLRLKRDPAAGPVRANRALWAWLRRHQRVEPALPAEGELDGPALRAYLAEFAASFNGLVMPDWDGPLVALTPTPSPGGRGEKVPLPPGEGFRVRDFTLLHSAVLGYWRWPFEALLEDLGNLKQAETLSAPLQALLDAAPLAVAQAVAPQEEDRYLVSSADFSQAQVIWQARQAPGLVAHGPPGTGKSQTIVNLIADALAHGKTVLMVCQKQAALQVVAERLHAAGLAGLCLHTQDAEADRLAVFRALREQAEHLPPELPAFPQAVERLHLAQQISALEQELDNFLRALHLPHPRLGIAYREALAIQGRCQREAGGPLDLPALQRLLADLPASEIDALAEQAEAAGALFSQAQPLKNPWRWRRPETRPGQRAEVESLIAALRQLDARHLAGHAAALPLPPDFARFPEQIETLLGQIEDLATRADPAGQMALAWLRALYFSGPLGLAWHEQRLQEARDLRRHSAPVRADWSARIGQLDDARLAEIENAAAWLARHHGRWWQHLLPGFYRARQRLQAFGNPPPAELLPEVRRHRAQQSLICLLQTLVPGFFYAGDALQDSFLEQAGRAWQEAAQLYQQMAAQAWLEPCLAALAGNAPDALRTALADVRGHLQRVPRAETLLAALERFTWLRPEALAEPRQAVLAGQSLGPWLDSVAEGFERLGPLIAWEEQQQRRSGLLARVLEVLESTARGLVTLVPTLRVGTQEAALCAASPQSGENPRSHAERGNERGGAEQGNEREKNQERADRPDWAMFVRYNAAVAWQQRIEQDAPCLLGFSPEDFRQKSQRLDSLLEQKRALESLAIRHAWLERQIPLRSRPWKRLLPLRGSKNGPARRLREGVRLGLDEGLLALRPCWLANPETVAQVFPLTPGLFDLVIFDEASQCPLEQAIPAIQRGKVLVVCGDEKQLPPTRFFTSQTEDNEDAPEREALEPPARRERLNREFLLQAEDLLEACVGVLPERYLRVHYRSLHPALIEFSNQAFYGSLLEAPPSAFSQDVAPIRYHAVQGTYRDRANSAEADAITGIVRDFARQGPDAPSLGIVTFNQPQRELIEDRLERACQQDAGFAAWYQGQLQRKAGNSDLGLFVKNLENVQGDERDVIIFSTTFGRDESGRFYRLFGPLGAAGGERRLNVAVTRARQQVIVAGSMPLADIAEALGNPQAPLTPAAYLQLYLAYAQAVSGNDHQAAGQALARLAGSGEAGVIPYLSDNFLQEVRDTLAQWGYASELRVGAAGFQIDLAVRHPQGGYLLGIVCDNGAYFPERGARLHCAWREHLLTQRGWRLYPLWSARWWQAGEEEKVRLKAALEEVQRG